MLLSLERRACSCSRSITSLMHVLLFGFLRRFSFSHCCRWHETWLVLEQEFDVSKRCVGFHKTLDLHLQSLGSSSIADIIAPAIGHCASSHCFPRSLLLQVVHCGVVWHGKSGYLVWMRQAQPVFETTCLSLLKMRVLASLAFLFLKGSVVWAFFITLGMLAVANVTI